MKRFKNLVIGGIENKVFNLILLTVILLTAAYLAVSIYHSQMLSDLAAESSQRQETSIEEITGSVMNSVVEKSMTKSTKVESLLADEMFHGLKTRVEMLGEYAHRLFSEPDQYPRTAVMAPDPAKNGEVLTQLILADGVDAEEPGLADRIGLAADMSDLMISLFGVSSETNSCFIALPEGVFLVTDDRTASKYDEDGNPVSYNPVSRPWYQLAVEQGKLSFTDVEIDAFTGDIGIVCSMPVYVDGELVAVVGSDLFLTSMREAVQASDEDGAYVCVVNQKGHVVFSPRTDGLFQVLPASEAKDLRTSENTELAALIQEAMHSETGMRLITLEEGASYYMFGAPMDTVGWCLLSVCSQESANQPVKMLQASYEDIQKEATDSYQKSTDRSRTTAVALLLGVTCLMLTGALILGKRIVRPLNQITEKISEISEDDMEFRMEDAYRTGDEIEALAQSFASISHRTVDYVQRIETVTAEKERIRSELSLATDIQAAMLPHIFPPFPGRSEFDIFATMNPAREVGGDFFDYFLIDDDHLGLVIADVSGKGVPAALFMMASKIILQSVAMLGHSAASILAKTNEAVCSNNEAQMFVTVWLGILEISTGKLTAANAGHEYPILKKPDGSYELYKDVHGFVIGGMDHIKYKEYELKLEPGSRLFVYTDGLPEATDANKEMFGTDRVLEVLNEHADASPAQVLEHMTKAVEGFVKDAEQFDDLTMLCLEYKGSQRKGGDPGEGNHTESCS